jgi:hypothetical protein
LIQSLDVPDSVEVFDVKWENSAAPLTIHFGDRSKLEQLRFSVRRLEGRNEPTKMIAFIQIPAARLKVLRCNGEFSY